LNADVFYPILSKLVWLVKTTARPKLARFFRHRLSHLSWLWSHYKIIILTYLLTYLLGRP